MNKLVAAACIAVIIGSGIVAAAAYVWWSDRNAEIAAVQRQKEKEQRIREAAQKSRCEAMVAAWNEGNQAALEAEYGSSAEKLVSNCRWLFDLR